MTGKFLALAGGVGGAKLANGLAGHLSPGALTIVVNTGDDTDHLGLRICPDLDTVMYTLAGINHSERGWGIASESWSFMGALDRIGGETWFQLGDQDLATHVIRTEQLRSRSLSQVTADLCGRIGVRHSVVPMSDDPVRSFVETDRGVLPFQDYFVRLRCEPRFIGITFEGIDTAAPAPGFLAALDDPELEAIIICPSNPLLSISPILSLAGVRERLRARRVPLVAVSPFIDGAAVKGPAAKILVELGMTASAASIAGIYGDLLDGLVLSEGDESGLPESLGLLATDTLMRDVADQIRLAGEVIEFTRAICV